MILDRLWGAPRMDRNGVFAQLKEQLHEGKAPDVSWVTSWTVVVRPKLGTSCVLIDVGQCCSVHDDDHRTTSTKHLISAPSEGHTHAQLACCTMTTESRSNAQHLIAPVIDTEFPTTRAEPHHRLNPVEQQVCKRATDEENETANSIVSRLDVERGHSDPRGMVDCL